MLRNDTASLRQPTDWAKAAEETEKYGSDKRGRGQLAPAFQFTIEPPFDNCAFSWYAKYIYLTNI